MRKGRNITVVPPLGKKIQAINDSLEGDLKYLRDNSAIWLLNTKW